MQMQKHVKATEIFTLEIHAQYRLPHLLGSGCVPLRFYHPNTSMYVLKKQATYSFQNFFHSSFAYKYIPKKKKYEVTPNIGGAMKICLKNKKQKKNISENRI